MWHVERSYTNRARKWVGESVSMTVRVPKPVADFIDSHFSPRIKNRSEYLQHWAMIGKLVSESDELDDALDWALGEAEPSILEVPMEPEPIGIGGTIVEVTEDHMLVQAGNNGMILPGPDELARIHDDQLEALRNRIK